MKYLISLFLVVLIGCEDNPTNKRVYYLSEKDVVILQDTMDEVACLKKETKYLKQRVDELEMSTAIVVPVPIPKRYPVRPELYCLKAFLPWALQPDMTRDTFFAHGKYKGGD